jgi:hypothetical protein
LTVSAAETFSDAFCCVLNTNRVFGTHRVNAIRQSDAHLDNSIRPDALTACTSLRTVKIFRRVLGGI